MGGTGGSVVSCVGCGDRGVLKLEGVRSTAAEGLYAGPQYPDSYLSFDSIGAAQGMG